MQKNAKRSTAPAERKKSTIASLVSEIVAKSPQKRMSIEDVEKELERGGRYKPHAAYGVLLKLAKAGFVVKREDGSYESINVCPPAQDRIISKLLARNRALKESARQAA